ncbi:GlsB/YeaQ/YmgE family stress response membrane protein [Klebsiella pneumoniae]|uniref:GlsB/YeaQ/YmgE family stress response membrane protein n=1 Tax=Klebsiella pneumoniae TaxID=573 RepID=A0A927HGJ2_KLEPN|nr:GlsB/YeaQ/YmgE family stress response membrane protein [Klebsiella pneumoniae]
MLKGNKRTVNHGYSFLGSFFGLIAGILAKWIMPGKDGGGFIVTVILGIIGAVVGGWISTLFGFGKVDGFNFGSFVVAVIGALVVLFIYRKVRS